ncbi:Hypothetical protein I595_3372 [Croceitalea dokdonensis DOKDO 023]|uniref:Uncharacterized protein n=1 Tax=Croceitalea dokdonensis DOKDO 023 TaxID=1300341 RepID=A0A0P7AYL0_9FLAO|nr:Hypothetical protein I595_3372 [Croceitalea dokdonensis DOKDO 023]
MVLRRKIYRITFLMETMVCDQTDFLNSYSDLKNGIGDIH